MKEVTCEGQEKNRWKERGKEGLDEQVMNRLDMQRRDSEAS